jgi:hypothetical protein
MKCAINSEQALVDGAEGKALDRSLSASQMLGFKERCRRKRGGGGLENLENKIQYDLRSSTRESLSYSSNLPFSRIYVRCDRVPVTHN